MNGATMQENAMKALVVVATGNEITDDGVITALALENSVMFGMTYGAWFKLGLGIALVLLLVERILNIIEKRRRLNETTVNTDK